MRVRAGGIDNSRAAPGLLLAWHLTATGDRWAQVRVELVNRGERGRLITETWVPENTVRPREEPAASLDDSPRSSSAGA